MHQQHTLSSRLLSVGVPVAAVVLLALCISQVDRHPRTDDATVRANAIAFAPEVEGRLVELNVQDNQSVHKGDVLFRIEPRPFQLALQQARADQATLEGEIDDRKRSIAAEQSAAAAAQAGVAGSRSGIEAAQGGSQAAKAAVQRALSAQASAAAQLAFARNDLQRILPLQSKHYVTVQQVDQAQTTVRVAEEAYRQSNSQLLQAQAQDSMATAATANAMAGLTAAQSKAGQAQHAVDTLETLESERADRAAKVEQAQLNLEWTEVRAPFDGYVANMNIAQGAYAHVGTPLFTLIDTGHWWVLADYRESRLKQIHTGMHVEVYLMEHPERRFNGVVDSVGRGVFPEDGAISNGLPAVDRTLNWVHLSARFPVRVRILDPDPDMFRIGATAITVVR